METAERRTEIMRVLCQKRHETISNLASAFGVSERTISRDIEVLSLTEPIYTQRGKHAGGIYVMENFSMTRMYMNDKEIAVLQKIAASIETKTMCDLEDEERALFMTIISQYTKPNSRKEKVK